MATVIDALVVTLGLDPKQFGKGMKDATDAQKKFKEEATKGSGEVEKGAKKATESFTKLRNELLGLAAAFVGMAALKSFAERITQTDANAGRLARSLNMSAKELSTWQGVAKRAGGTAEGISGSFQTLVSQFENFSLTGQPGSAIPYFRALGIAIADGQGKMRSMTDISLDVAQAFHGMDAAKAHALGSGMGYDARTVDVLLKGPKALREMLALETQRTEKTQQELALAEKRQAAWEAFKDVVSDIGTKVMTQLTPAILAVVGAMDGIAQFLRNNVPLVDAMLLGLGAIAALKFAGLISTLATVAAGFAATAGAAGVLATIAAVLSGVGLVAGGVALAGGIGYGIYKGYQALTGPNASGASAGPVANSSELDDLFTALTKQESGGRHRNADGSLITNARSGARGIAQIMPGTGASPGFGIRPLQDDSEVEHRRVGREYLAAMLARYGGDKRKALAAYNWGPGNVDRDPTLSHAPAETLNYVPSVLSLLSQGNRGGARGGNTSSTEVGINTMNVYTQATDAPGIARSMGTALEQYTFASQANAGLN